MSDVLKGLEQLALFTVNEHDCDPHAVGQEGTVSS